MSYIAEMQTRRANMESMQLTYNNSPMVSFTAILPPLEIKASNLSQSSGKNKIKCSCP